MEVINFNVEHKGKTTKKMTFNLSDTIKNVLDKVCENFNVSPETYELRHDNKLLDSNLQLKLSDLPPEAHLQLCSCQCSSEQGVLVDLTIGNTTHSKRFRCSASLWDVVNELLPRERFIEDDRLQVTYFGEKIIGLTNLKKTRLASLSQKEGKLSLRLSRQYSDADLINSTKSRKNVISGKSSIRSQTLPSEVGTSSTGNSEKGFQTAHSTKMRIKLPTYPYHGSVKALTSVDKNIYMNNKEKLKGIVHLDERKGLIYNLKNLMIFGKAGSDLLSFTEDNVGSATGREKEINLKVMFQDKSVIQATFGVEETVGDVYDFIANILKCPTTHFILYTKNPMTDLDKQCFLKNLSCIPEDMLYVRPSPGVLNYSLFPLMKILDRRSLSKSISVPPKRWMLSIKKD